MTREAIVQLVRNGLDDVRARRRAEAERAAETARVDRLRAAVRAQLDRTDPRDPTALVELGHALDGLLAVPGDQREAHRAS